MGQWAMNMAVDLRKKGRPKRRWIDWVSEEMEAVGANEEEV